MIFCIMVTVVLATVAIATTTVAVVSSSSISFQGNQTAQHTNKQPYNATENMISTFKTADSLLHKH
jgi:flagellar basal body-associated protein FliL